jgi:type I restriction enzyme R subunit
LSIDTANAIDAIIKHHVTDNDRVVVDWQNKGKIIGKMKIEIEDYLIDEVKRKHEIPMTFDDMDRIIDRCVDVAKLWFKQ